ncbi:glycosyltransferase [Campylobacter sp. RM12642]|uniref:glycosyltransferase family 2 protein n=1 Tax=Campylobacter sp. RM12642 TaxID=2735736 RepID=UPI0030153AB0|nr:glycosyltransferase [Campylobacter sp. RM12642]
MNINNIIVKNAEGDPDTKATILIKNKIDYTPKVSVIIPVYNTEKYLGECLDSVINQSLKEIEIICVDDGSTDNSLEILKEYAAKDNRITVLTQENLYAGVARNAGMMVASGEYYHFLDSDDWVKCNIYEQLLTNIFETDIVIFANDIYDDITKKIIGRTYLPNYSFDKKIKNIFNITNPNAWTKIFNSQLINKYKIYFQALQVVNDLAFTYICIALTNKIKLLNNSYVIYRTNQCSNLTANRGDKIECFARAIQFLYDSLCKHNIYNKYNQSFLDRVNSSFIYELSYCNDSYEVIKAKLKFIVNDKIYNFLSSLLRPKISIIICVYNGEDYIEQCLKSVIGQTIRDIEIICVNDGSCDSTLSILEKYSCIDNRITIINQTNQGLSISRNNAFLVAKGFYIQYIDADDYIDSFACEKIFTKAFRNKLDMLMIGGMNFDNNNNISCNDYYSFRYIPNDFKDIFNYKDCREFITKIAVSSCLTIYNRDFLVKNKILWVNKKICFEDNLFFIESLFKAKKISILRDKIYFRRVHDDSITQNLEKKFLDKIIIVELLSQMLPRITSDEFINIYMLFYVNILYANYKSFNAQYKKHYKGYLIRVIAKIINTYKLQVSRELELFIKDNFGIYYQEINSARFDIKNFGFHNQIELIEEVDLILPISTNKSNGYNIIGNCNKIIFKNKGIGYLIIELFNIDNIEVIYNKVYLNGKNILKNPIKVNANSSVKIKQFLLKEEILFLNLDYYSGNGKFNIKIRNYRTATNRIELLEHSFKSTNPIWFTNQDGIGSVVIDNNLKTNFKIKIVGDGILMLKFLGIDKRLNDIRVPVYVLYNSIKINGTELLQNPLLSWHDDAYIYKISVKDKQIISVDIDRGHYLYDIKDICKIVPNITHADFYDFNLVIEELKFNIKKNYSYYWFLIMKLIKFIFRSKK